MPKKKKKIDYSGSKYYKSVGESLGLSKDQMKSKKKSVKKTSKFTEKTGLNKDDLKPCPPGHKRVDGKCVQKGVGKEYKP